MNVDACLIWTFTSNIKSLKFIYTLSGKNAFIRSADPHTQQTRWLDIDVAQVIDLQPPDKLKTGLRFLSYISFLVIFS